MEFDSEGNYQQQVSELLKIQGDIDEQFDAVSGEIGPLIYKNVCAELKKVIFALIQNIF